MRAQKGAFSSDLLDPQLWPTVAWSVGSGSCLLGSQRASLGAWVSWVRSCFSVQLPESCSYLVFLLGFVTAAPLCMCEPEKVHK